MPCWRARRNRTSATAGAGGIDELGIDVHAHAGADVDEDGPVLPLVADLERLLQRAAQPHDEVHAARQHVGDEGIGIQNEPHLDLVDLRTAEHVLVVGGHNQVAPLTDLAQFERPGPDELLEPEGEVHEAGLVLRIGSFEQMGWHGEGQGAGEHAVGVDERALPAHDHCSQIGSVHRLDRAVRGIAEDRDFALLTQASGEDQIPGREGSAVVPLGTGRMVQVISMRPSGKTFQRPLSRLGTASASWGSRASWLS